MYKNLIAKLKNEGIKFSSGMTNEEFMEIENLYNLFFPSELKSFYSNALPISKGFYNWRDFTTGNVLKIKNIIKSFKEDILMDISEIEWSELWGKEPESVEDRCAIIANKLENAPSMIPIYRHKAMASIEVMNNPVFSIVGTDVIYYGVNIKDYFDNEFGLSKRKSRKLKDFTYIPFWSDLS